MVEAKAQVTSHATPEGKMPCHDAEAKTTSDVAPHAATGLHTSSDVSVSTDDGTSLPDCCESGACRCACLHHGQFAPRSEEPRLWKECVSTGRFRGSPLP